MEQKKQHIFKSKMGIWVLIIGLLCLVLAGFLWFESMNQTKKTALVAAENQEKHAEDEDHEEGEEGHEGHDDHDEAEVIRLSETEMEEFGIKVVQADSGTLRRYVHLPGEIQPNGDRLAHIVPRVPGVVRRVFKGLGDRVKKGEVMAVLDSRELSDTKADFLAASERVGLAQSNFDREETLWKKKISSEQDYLEAKQALAEAKIARRSAEQKLHALGFSERYVKDLPNHPEESFTQYQITAPFSGTVIKKHITLGEFLRDDAEAFLIADLSSVWVDLAVYQKDLPFVAEGQSVIVEATQGKIKTTGKLSYLGPVIGEGTRTTLARIVIPNKDGLWRPGLFVNARIAVDEFQADLIVPKSALQNMEDQTVLFVMSQGELSPKPVTLGWNDETHVEITGGIYWGDLYVAEGGFTLRAQLGKGNLGDGHNH